jgi:putative ABC transport system ATP-binding protein
MAVGIAPIEIEALDHFFGDGALRKQILHDVSVQVDAGEIVIVTGPSGSGKTTLLTLIGALRTAQGGSLRILGRELRGARAGILQSVRREIGYIFQAHNLLGALTARQNVEMSLRLHPLGAREIRDRASELLGAVGLAERLDHFPEQLSGGQRQRVAIARAIASRPRLILADEPTASLDKQSGRDVVDLMQRLAREQGVTVLLVTHDNRILDVADRILHLEDGRIQSFTRAVTQNTRHMMEMLAQSQRKGDLARRLSSLPDREFAELLQTVTGEAQQFLEVVEMSEREAFSSMLEQTLRASTDRLGRLLQAERASLFLVDRERDELWLRVAQEEGGRPVDLRIPLGSGIAGQVARTGEKLRVDDAYAHPLFNPDVDRQTGFRTKSILCVPLHDRRGEVFAVAQLLNKESGSPFDTADERRFAEFAGSLGVILESWHRMSRRRSAGSAGG